MVQAVTKREREGKFLQAVIGSVTGQAAAS